MKLENTIFVKLVRLRKLKVACSPLYAYYRLKTNAWSHTKGRLCMGGIVKGKKTKNLNVVDVLTVEEQI
jgi:hypothetical protein